MSHRIPDSRYRSAAPAGPDHAPGCQPRTAHAALPTATGRRHFVRAVAATGLCSVTSPLLAQAVPGPSFGFKPNQRYPDPAIQILDPSFTKYRLYSSTVEQVASGFRWAEGPAWFPDGGYLLFSDIPNNRIMRFDEATGKLSVFRQPANYANGNTRDRQGRLVTCEHSVTRRVTRTERDGSITVLAERFDGRRLNAPNDVVVKSDDSIWFTDPLFGINGNWEGDKARSEQPTTNVYRIAPDGRLDAVLTDLVRQRRRAGGRADGDARPARP